MPVAFQSLALGNVDSSKFSCFSLIQIEFQSCRDMNDMELTPVPNRVPRGGRGQRVVRFRTDHNSSVSCSRLCG